MIVITGASGLIGRSVTSRLVSEKIPFIAVKKEKLNDLASFQSAVPTKPSPVIHLAAVVPQPPKILDDLDNAEQTCHIDMTVLQAIKSWKCHAIYASGCSLYDKSDKNFCSEFDIDYLRPPSSNYLRAKMKGEKLFMNHGNATILRISAPIGEGMPSSTVLGRFIEIAKDGGSINIWGDGSREQNYVDVFDISDAIYRSLMIQPIKAINISADHPIQMWELAHMVIKACGRGSVSMTNKVDPKDGETARYSNNIANDLLGWRPKISLKSSLNRLCSFS